MSNVAGVTERPMTSEQISERKRQLDQSEAMHHKIMAMMSDPRFHLLEAWLRKEQLDQEIGTFIRRSLGAQAGWRFCVEHIFSDGGRDDWRAAPIEHGHVVSGDVEQSAIPQVFDRCSRLLLGNDRR